jgi:hypothetical protein
MFNAELRERDSREALLVSELGMILVLRGKKVLPAEDFA